MIKQSHFWVWVIELGSPRDIYTSMLTEEVFKLAEMWKQHKCQATDEWIKKMWSIHAVNTHSTFLKNEISQHVATWINIIDIMLSWINQRQKYRYCIIYSHEISKIFKFTKLKTRTVVSRAWLTWEGGIANY